MTYKTFDQKINEQLGIINCLCLRFVVIECAKIVPKKPLRPMLQDSDIQRITGHSSREIAKLIFASR